MPRSKRNKVVTLTKIGGKGRDFKATLVNTLRDTIDQYKNIFVLKFDNLRSSRMRDVRMHWKESRIFLGKNTIAQVALGRTSEEEYKENLHCISEKLEGNVGLLFTDRSKKEVLKYFSILSYPEFAKAGTVAEESVVLNPGSLDFNPSMMEHLRKLGLAVEIVNGSLELKNSFIVAKAGAPLTPEQAKMLVHLNNPIINFKIEVLSFWSNGKIEEFEN